MLTDIVDKILVVDSSVGVKWVNSTKENLLDKANQILKDVQKEKIKLVMPELAKYEIGNSLLKKELTVNQLQSTLENFYKLPIQFFPETKELAAIAAMIVSENELTYYDASFLALAQKLKANLVTDNLKHQGKYKSKGVRVIALKDYK